MANPTFTTLPTEILQNIFLRLDKISLLNVSYTCKSIKRISSDSQFIWRDLCRWNFENWDTRHDIQVKYSGSIDAVDWRSLFIYRIRVERRTRQLLDQIVSTQHGRIRHMNELADLGYDALDELIERMSGESHTEAPLAYSYYATAAYERIQRERAINIWKGLQDGKDVPIEEALGAFDVFVRSDEGSDIRQVTKRINRLAQRVLKKYPSFSSMSTREQASTLATYLRDKGFRGVSDEAYRQLGNSFIGVVLDEEEHQSLPLISVAIYCAVARKLGLDARPCGFLFHVYALVYARKDYNLDGKYVPTNTSRVDFMYLDPFRTSTEVLQGDLLRVLHDMAVPSSEHAGFLSDTTTREMVLRTARNIMNSVQLVRQAPLPQDPQSRDLPHWCVLYPDLDNSFYASIWVMMLLGHSMNGETAELSSTTTRRRQYLPYILDHLQTHFPWDVALLTDYVIPMFANQPESIRLAQFVQSVQQADGIPPQPKTIHPPSVTYRVGQLFRHKRYNYEGIITGWDASCDAGEEWINNMGVDRLANGRNQAFYHVL